MGTLSNVGFTRYYTKVHIFQVLKHIISRYPKVLHHHLKLPRYYTKGHLFQVLVLGHIILSYPDTKLWSICSRYSGTSYNLGTTSQATLTYYTMVSSLPVSQATPRYSTKGHLFQVLRHTISSYLDTTPRSFCSRYLGYPQVLNNFIISFQTNLNCEISYSTTVHTFSLSNLANFASLSHVR